MRSAKSIKGSFVIKIGGVKMVKDVKRIAIVGMGVAGISVLREWAKQKKLHPSIQLTVFGDKNTFGTGFPYKKDSDILLMNVFAKFTTIIPQSKDDFVEWLQTTQGIDHPEFGFYPRQLFGEYLTERMNDWLKQSNASVIKEKVNTIHRLDNNKFRLIFDSGMSDFDFVHLCIGHLPYKDPYDLINNPRFIVNPFPISEKLSVIPKGSSVGVLGTGLTSIDIFRYIHFKRPDIKLSFFSRTGRFKAIIGEYNEVNHKYFTLENIQRVKAENDGFIPLEKYIDWFKKEFDNKQLLLKMDLENYDFGSKNTIEWQLNNLDKIGLIQGPIINMNHLLTKLWMALTETDKQNFLERYYDKWEKLISSTSPMSAKLLLSAWKTNEINVFENLEDIVYRGDHFKIILKNKQHHVFDYIINASGNDKNVSYKQHRNNLLFQLLNERLLQPETFGGVQVTLPDFSAVSQKYGVIKNFKIHGQLVSGIQFGNNSVNIVSDSAKPAVDDIVKSL